MMPTESFSYTIVKSRRRTLAAEVRPDGSVTIRVPLAAGKKDVERFLNEKSDWIAKHVKAAQSGSKQEKLTEKELKELKKRAKQLFCEKVARFADLTEVSYGGISVRSQKTLWGSCTRKGNLSFNCLLLLLPEEIADYVVVHELCHRKRMDHSPLFWKEVEKILPDYKARKKYLKSEGRKVLARL